MNETMVRIRFFYFLIDNERIVSFFVVVEVQLTWINTVITYTHPTKQKSKKKKKRKKEGRIRKENSKS